VGTDTEEFIELLALQDVDLEGVLLILLNGSVTPGQEYARLDLSPFGTVTGGTYIVICGSAVTVAPGGMRYTPAGWESSNRIQNGPHDAVMLWDAIGARVIDTVSYNGTLHRALITGDTAEWDATEGSAGAPADSNAVPGSLSRSPDATDTGENGADFKFTPSMTPGAGNG
jgi:large repetitive protein